MLDVTNRLKVGPLTNPPRSVPATSQPEDDGPRLTNSALQVRREDAELLLFRRVDARRVGRPQVQALLDVWQNIRELVELARIPAGPARSSGSRWAARI